MSAAKPHKPNTGVLYPTKEKWRAGKEGRPDMTGEVTIACPTCNCASRKRVAVWSKQNDYGPYLSLAFSDPSVQKQNGGAK